jgi:hypothetical protein
MPQATSVGSLGRWASLAAESDCGVTCRSSSPSTPAPSCSRSYPAEPGGSAHRRLGSSEGPPGCSLRLQRATGIEPVLRAWKTRACLPEPDRPRGDHRQQVLRDRLAQPAVVREVYALALEALEARRAAFFAYQGASADSILHGAVQILERLVDALKRLRRIADDHASEFRSTGFRRFFEMLASKLDDDYFDTIADHLHRGFMNDRCNGPTVTIQGEVAILSRRAMRLAP